MRFISKYRRHRFAGALLLLSALIFAALTYSAAQAATKQVTLSQSDKATLIAEGKEIFARGCSSCHGLNAEGTAVGPSLIGLGAASVDFQVATGFHGLHVTGGLIAFLIVMIRVSKARRFGHSQATTAIVVSYYWHFVDIVWIALFSAIYLVA